MTSHVSWAFCICASKSLYFFANIRYCVTLQTSRTRNTRIVIDGDPGAGKTTFIKRLCYVWAQSVLQNDINDEGLKYLQKYSIVVPVILRLLSTEQRMLDILTSQFSFLSVCEICAMVNLIEKNSKVILLLQDGYDEYSGRTIISKVISKEEHPEVLSITTSRPHAVEQLRRQTSQAVEHHVRLCGFSKDQVKQYIKQFCEYHSKPPETGEELIRVLFKERPDILEVAKIPIRTEMICIVWMVYGRLGKTLADLYEMFIIHLIVHWTNKQGLTENKDNVTEQHMPLLLKVGKVCNQWEKYHRLRIVFSTKELKEILGEDFNKVIEIGLIVKSHPSNILEESKWSFPHLTIQEYFVAYLLGNDSSDPIISSFTTKCKNYKVLRRCEVIFTFLCSKYPDVANKILTKLILEEKNETGCKELTDFIFRIIPHFDSSMMNIPLPCYLHLKSDQNKDKVYTLLESETRQAQPNLKHLTIEKPGEFNKFMEVTYIEDLKVTIYDGEDKKCVRQKVNKLTKLTSINISSKVSLSTGDAYMMKNINSDRLTDLSVIAPGALQAVAGSIQRFSALQQLHVDDTSRDSNKLQAQKILSSLRNNYNIIQVSLCVPDLNDRIIKEKLNMKVKLKEDTLSDGSLRKAVTGLDFTGGLYKLDLSYNNLRDEGESLGKLMARMTALRVLCVCRCNIKADTVQAMIKAIRELQVTSHLHTLNMGDYRGYNNNNLSSGGVYLGELISLTPDLHTLDLDECALTKSDLADMSDNLQQSNKIQTKIQTLNLWYNNLGDGTGGGSRLIQNMPNLQAIRGGGLIKHDLIPAVCGAVDTGSLRNNLYILDMSNSDLQPGSLQLLGQHLPNMNKLQVISLRGISNVKPDDYRHVYGNVTESLQHLNVWSDYVRLDGYLLVEHKQQLRHLLRLNVNIPDTDLDMVQELLEQHNPDIHVYNDRDEIIQEFPYADNLKAAINNKEENQFVSQKLKKFTKLTSINISSKVSLSTGDAYMMKNVNSDRLTDLSVIAPDALEAVADNIQRFSALQQLHVDDTSRDSNKLQAQKILSSLRDNNNIIQVSLCVPDLNDRIIKEKLNMKVKLKVKEDTLSDGSLKKAVTGLDFTGGLYKLDLSYNNLRDEGESLGKLMARMTALRVLCVCRCNIKADTVQAMIKAIRELQVTSHLHTVNMGDYRGYNNNNLSSGGVYLGELISLTPDLHTLDLDECALTKSDLADMSDNLQQSNKIQTKIQTLNLWYNNLGDGTGGGSRLIQNMPNLQAIRGGGLIKHDLIPAVCGAADTGSLRNNLYILDMSNSDLQPGSLQLLGQHLPNMNKLQVISLRGISNVKPDDYRHVYGNVTESLQHLNVWSDYVRLDGYLLVEHKQQLRHLLRLNVNIPDTDLDMVQELLEQHNPDIHVYNDRDEIIQEFPFADNLKAAINNKEENQFVSQKLKKFTKLTSINISSKVSLSTGDAYMMKNVNSDRLTDLSVIAPDALEAVADSIQRFTALQQLHVDDTSRDSNKLQAQRILSSLRNNNNIEQVSLCVPGLDDRIIKETLNMKVKLKVKMNTLRKDSLRKAVRGLDFTGGLYKLDLSCNNLRDEGDSLGKLMARMTALRVLCVGWCNIEAYTVQAMVKAVRELQVTSHLHTLNMKRNNLSSGGLYLGELISLTPDLHTLNLGLCELIPSDVDDMSDNLQQTNKIQTLNLEWNNLGDGTGGGSRLIQNMPHLQTIRGGGGYNIYYNPIPAMCGAVDAGSLNKLHILDMSYSVLEDGSLHMLGQHLPNMNKLQVISLRVISKVKPEDYHHVYGNIPESLQHLNVWSDPNNDGVRLDGYRLVKYKQQLRHLHRLNVNIPDTDLDMVQEQLEHPDLHVYNDGGEDIWEMYVSLD